MEPVELTEEDRIVLSPCKCLTLAKDQPEYIPLPIAKLDTRTEVPLVSRWRLSDEERAVIAAGGDIYLTLMSFGRPHMPVMLSTAVPYFDGDQSTVRG